MRNLVASILVFVSACGVQQSRDPPVVDEEELARNDVWHAARLRGVAFRALGQEPGWLLEIKNGEEILIVTDYGQNRVAYPYIEPQEDKAAGKTVLQVDEDVSVLIESIGCTDSMSGESFEVTVTLTTGGQAYKGCGRALFLGK
jgi:putative lipoprotein